MIYKLQLPIVSSGPNQPLLAYTEGRRNMKEIRLTPDLKKLFGARLKIYVEANVTADGGLDVVKPVSDRRW